MRLATTVLVNLLVASLYFLTGKIGLHLAIPPGYATVVWPPSGVALGAVLIGGFRYLPGIGLGSFALNLWVSASKNIAIDYSVFAPALVIAVGAILQAFFAGWLVRRYISVPFELRKGQEVPKFLFLAGPVGSLVNATWSVTILTLMGVVSTSAALSNWLTWWTGDVIGVLTVTPILMTFVARPRVLWAKRIKIISGPLILSLILTFAAFRQANSASKTRVRREFEAQALLFSQNMKDSLDRFSNLLGTFRGYFVLTGAEISRERFEHYAETIFPLYPGVKAVSWNPLRRTNGREVVDESRLFVAPKEAAKTLKPTQVDEKAFLSMIRTGPLRFPIVKSDKSSEMEMLYVLPLYNRDIRKQYRRLEDRLIGYLTARVEVESVVATALLKTFEKNDVHLIVRDDLGNIVFQQGSADQTDINMVFERPFDGSSERPWSMALSPSPSYIESHRTSRPGTVLIIGLLFTSVLGGFLLILAARNEELSNEVEQRRLFEQQLRRARDLAEGANRAKSTFIANMSHEIRTPLNAILGFSQLLSDKASTDDERLQYAKVVRKNGDLLCHIIDDILDISKIEAGRIKIETSAVSMNELLKDLEILFASQAEKKGNEFVFVAEGEIPPVVRTDPHRLRQILLNIIGNAMKFTDKGKVELRVKTVPQEGSDVLLVFEVSDSGIGIKEEDATRLFEPFSQVEESRIGGTGLGLALSRRFARLLGGDVNLTKSEPGKGSRFTITIRASTDVKLEEAVPVSKAGLKGLKILVAEDSPDSRMYITKVAAKAGMIPHNVENGAEAVDMLPSIEPDIVLMDLQMPVMDGYAATAELRKKGYKGPIVALTAHARLKERSKALSLGFSDFLTKPIEPDQFYNCVARHTANPPNPEV